MTVETRPLAEITEEALTMLYEKLGTVDTIRFLNQYTMGFGDYTREREALFQNETLESIVDEIEDHRAASAKPLAKRKNRRKSITVSKADLVDLVAVKTDLKKKEVKSVIDNTIKEISSHLDRDYKVQLTGFGTFEVHRRKARTGVKPGTTEKIRIPAGRYPVFKPGKALDDESD